MSSSAGSLPNSIPTSTGGATDAPPGVSDGGAVGTSHFSYDWAGRLVSTATPWSATATTVWNLDGTIAGRKWADGTDPLAYTYDAAKRPTRAAKGSIVSITQTYDRANNVTGDDRTFTGTSGIDGDAAGGTATYTYDRLGRLVGETGLATAKTYTYDLDGNRTRKVEGGVTFDYTYDRVDQLATVNKGAGRPDLHLGRLRQHDRQRPERGRCHELRLRLRRPPDRDRLAGQRHRRHVHLRRPGAVPDPGPLRGRHRHLLVPGTSEPWSGSPTPVAPRPTRSSMPPATGSGSRQAGTVNWLLPDLGGSVAGGPHGHGHLAHRRPAVRRLRGDRRRRPAQAQSARATSGTRAGSTSAPVAPRSTT